MWGNIGPGAAQQSRATMRFASMRIFAAALGAAFCRSRQPARQRRKAPTQRPGPPRQQSRRRGKARRSSTNLPKPPSSWAVLPPIPNASGSAAAWSRLLWRDDLDTAFRHLDLYDRFGCPAGHIQATFRCLVRQGNHRSERPGDADRPRPRLLDQSGARSQARPSDPVGGSASQATTQPLSCTTVQTTRI